MATTPNYDINYNDERFGKVESEKNQALTQLEQTYGGMVGESDKYYQAQIDASKQWAETQKQQQQANTDFAIEKIEQQKDQAHKSYLKEQSGAYTDWQKQSNKYGVRAEQQASQGLIGGGYSESSQVSMFNTYQNRVATARESYNNAVINYNNSIKDAQLQNNSALAEIAYKALQQQLELSLQGFQYKNQLLLEQASKKQELENTYYGRYQDVLAQINKEHALAEEVRQYNENLAMEQKRLEQEQAQWEKEYALEQQRLQEEIRQFNASQSAKSSGGGSSRSYSTSKSSGGGGNNTPKIAKNVYASPVLPKKVTPQPIKTGAELLKEMAKFKSRSVQTGNIKVKNGKLMM